MSNLLALNPSCVASSLQTLPSLWSTVNTQLQLPWLPTRCHLFIHLCLLLPPVLGLLPFCSTVSSGSILGIFKLFLLFKWWAPSKNIWQRWETSMGIKTLATTPTILLMASYGTLPERPCCSPGLYPLPLSEFPCLCGTHPLLCNSLRETPNSILIDSFSCLA